MLQSRNVVRSLRGLAEWARVASAASASSSTSASSAWTPLKPQESTLFAPSRIVTGGGSIAAVPDLVKELKPGAGVLVITDPGMVATGKSAILEQHLRDAGVSFETFSDTVPDPTSAAVEAGARAWGRSGLDLGAVVALGGGSAIDTAKAVKALLTSGAAGAGAVRALKAPSVVSAGGPPLVAVPTTAGTGSEMTKAAVITDSETGEKMLLMGPGLVPDGAVIDYELTLSCPFRLTADNAVDALAHAIEAFVSVRASPFTDALALRAMSEVASNVLAVRDAPGDRKARAALMHAASVAGLAFSNSSVALVHGMSRPVGAHFKVPHGLANAMLLPAVTAFSLRGAPGRFAECARAVGACARDAPDDEAGLALVEFLRGVNRALSVPSPRAFGVDKGEWGRMGEQMAAEALASGSPANNPVVPTAAEIVALYAEAYEGGWQSAEAAPTAWSDAPFEVAL